jgi:hypothetical protein
MGIAKNLTASAGNPGLFSLNKQKLKALRPQLFWPQNILTNSSVDNPAAIEALLNDGDIQPAVVVSVRPLLVACYSDEMDAAVLLCFPDGLAGKYGLKEGSRLLTVNGYTAAFGARDIERGPGYCGRWKAFGPIVADFYTDDTVRLTAQKLQIPEELWAYVEQLGRKYMADRPGMARNGLAYRFRNPQPIDRIRWNSKISLG